MHTAPAADARPLDAESLIGRLEEAGAALLALPGTGWSTKLRGSSLEIVRAAVDGYGWTTNRIRPPVPSAAAITRMDEAMTWISLIPLDRYVLRRIVGARSLVHRSPVGICFPGAGSRPHLGLTIRRYSVGTRRGST